MTGQPVTRDVPAIVALAPGLIILDLLTGSEKVGLVLLQMLKMTPSTRTVPVVDHCRPQQCRAVGSR